MQRMSQENIFDYVWKVASLLCSHSKGGDWGECGSFIWSGNRRDKINEVAQVNVNRNPSTPTGEIVVGADTFQTSFEGH